MSEPIIAPGWITTDQAAQLTGYGAVYIRRLAREGRIPIRPSVRPSGMPAYHQGARPAAENSPPLFTRKYLTIRDFHGILVA